MADWTVSAIMIVGFILFLFFQSQNRFKNKMLCYFIRPNKQRIEKWVPLHSTHVVFDRGQYGVARYICDPECITMLWYERGINKFFPVLVPVLEFKWDTPNALNPTTFESTWHTPEARQAAWEEHQHVAFARAAAVAAGTKTNKMITVLLPVITVGLVLIVLFIVYQGMAGLDERMFYLEQQLKLLH